MATYLVTGGAGFIGSNFVLHILAQHPDTHVINVDVLTYAGNLENLCDVEDDPRYTFVRADICDRATMRELVAAYDPDYVVNFAAESHVDRSILDAGVFCTTNVGGTQVLLDVVRDAWALPQGGFAEKKFLQVSTDEVYGSLPEDDPSVLFSEQTPLAPRSPYSASKASADLFVLAYASTWGLPVNITRCSNNYGRFQFPEKLIPLMFRNACALEALPLYGDGGNVRDWLHVDDHCRAIDLVLTQGRPGEIYNVGGNNERTNAQIVEQIISYVREHINPDASSTLIEHVADRLGHDRRYGIDASKIRRDLGWEPQVCFDEGIIQTLDWYATHTSWIDRVTQGSYQEYYERMYANRGRA